MLGCLILAVIMASKRNKNLWSPWRKANYSFFEARLAHVPRSSTLLDLGAGDIQFADLFFQFKYTGVDFEAYPDVTHVADLTQALSLASESYDIVTLSNTLEHIPDTAFLIDECYRVLGDNGMIIGTVPFLMTVHQAPHDFNRLRIINCAGFWSMQDSLTLL